MKFDTVIIGGGLCGLMAGIRLAERNQKVAIVSSGQSALHFCAGSFGLLGRLAGKEIKNPLDGISHLNSKHPYQIMGRDAVQYYAVEAKETLAKAGIETYGLVEDNHITLTPFGAPKSAWLTLDGYYCSFEDKLPKLDNVVIISLKGFLEAYPSFIATNLSKLGKKCRIEVLDVPSISKLRAANYDMRTISIAKHLKEEEIREIANAINATVDAEETVFFPAVIGDKDASLCRLLKELVKNPIFFSPTLPVSVAGVRTQHLLQHKFEKLGGTLLQGDKVVKGFLEGTKVKCLETQNFEEDHLYADNYVLSTGFLFGEGIVATPFQFKETVFGLDLVSSDSREDWYTNNFFSEQPYMNYGVSFTEDFHPCKDGAIINNLYVAGSILSNCNSLAEESGGGIAMLTALKVADSICGIEKAESKIK